MQRRTLLGRVLALGLLTLAGTPSHMVYGAEDLAGGKKSLAGNAAAQANNDFACDLYRVLAQDNAGKNVFFSPYSISSALALTLEGARGETAGEMGKVLRLPEALRAADDAKLPWKTAPYHLAFNELNRRYNEKPDAVKDQALRAKLAALRAELAKINARITNNKTPPNESFKLQNEARKLADAVNALSKQLDQYELRVANAVWAEKTYPFDKNYFDAISKYYGSDTLRTADFIGNFPAERAQINGWVEKQTNDRIKDLVPSFPEELARRIRMILVNAIFFKGQWETPFDAKRTKNEDFLLANGTKAKAPMMHAFDLGTARYAAFNGDGSYFDTPRQIAFEDKKAQTYPGGDGFLIAELPVKGDKLSMVVIAPQKADGLPALEARLTGKNLSTWLGNLQGRSVHLSMPKFKMDTNYSLKEALQKLGMKSAFGERQADFTGMSTSSNPDDRLSISHVLHKAFVEVNEEGAEAAAATAVIMVVPTSAVINAPFTPTFRADRPFLFLIRDMESGAVLFVGRVTEPPATVK